MAEEEYLVYMGTKAELGSFGMAEVGDTGIIIADTTLGATLRRQGVPEEYIPLLCANQYSGDASEEIGLIDYDSLGVGTAVLIQDSTCGPTVKSLADTISLSEGSIVDLSGEDCGTNNNNGDGSTNIGNSIPLALSNKEKDCNCIPYNGKSGNDHSYPPGGRWLDDCGIVTPYDDPDLRCLGTYQYRCFDITLSKPMWAGDIITMDLSMHSYCNQYGFQCWYPCGGIRIGIRSMPNWITHPTNPLYNTWFWFNDANPIPVIRGSPAFYSAPEQGEDNDSGTTNYYVDDFLIHFLIPDNLPIYSIRIWVDTASSQYWTNYVKEGRVTGDWCLKSAESPFTRLFEEPNFDRIEEMKEARDSAGNVSSANK
jgi:hypothetical protein